MIIASIVNEVLKMGVELSFLSGGVLMLIAAWLSHKGKRHNIFILVGYLFWCLTYVLVCTLIIQTMLTTRGSV